MKKILLLFICWFSSFFAFSNQKIDPTKTPTPQAKVCIYRPAHFVGFGDAFSLKVNGERMGHVKNGRKLLLTLPVGSTKFELRGTTVTLELQEGRTYYLRSVLVRNMLLGKPDLASVTDDFAKTELKSIK